MVKKWEENSDERESSDEREQLLQGREYYSYYFHINKFMNHKNIST